MAHAHVSLIFILTADKKTEWEDILEALTPLPLTYQPETYVSDYILQSFKFMFLLKDSKDNSSSMFKNLETKEDAFNWSYKV